MPPKRNQRNASDDEDETPVVAAATTPARGANRKAAKEAESDDDGSGAEGGRTAEQNAFMDNLELLLEKKGSTRTGALRKLAELLRMHVYGDFLENEAATLLLYTLRRVKGSAAEEVALAADVLALAFLQLPYGLIIDEIEEIRKTLLVVAHDHTVDPAARAACLRAVALCVSLAGNAHFDSASLMTDELNRYLDPASSAPPAVAAAAVEAWSFLLTDLPASYAQQHFADAGAQLAALVEHSSDLALRMACGEALAVLHEAAPAVDTAVSVEFLDFLQELASESTKHKSKKDLKEQRSFFRKIVATLENGEPYDAETLTLAGGSVEIDGWVAARRMAVYRSYLESGLPVHARENEAFRDEWGLGPTASAFAGEARLTRATATTAEERRLLRLEQNLRSRDRDRDRNRNRDFKHMQSGFS